jgi:hypothetical protein
MRPTRRDFLRYLLATPIALQLDVEKLLWVPKTQIVVPNITIYSLSDIIEAEMDRIAPILASLFDRDDLFYKILNEPEPIVIGKSSRELKIPLEMIDRTGEI